MKDYAYDLLKYFNYLLVFPTITITKKVVLLLVETLCQLAASIFTNYQITLHVNVVLK